MTTDRDLSAWLAGFFDQSSIPVGIGDDAAVVTNRGPTSVLACDPVVAGVHFAADAPLRSVGNKAVERNLSDLAAIGAKPDYLVVSALLSSDIDARRRRSLFGGVRRAAQRARCKVVGGDVAKTPGPLTLTVTAVGHLPGRALLRSGARRGDTIHVTGPLGGSIAGHHLRFRARVAEGLWLAKQPAVTAAIDVSDGLVLDLDRVLAASGVRGAVLDERAIPIRTAARRLAHAGGRTAIERALGDGEDYELLFTVRAGAKLPRGGPLSPRARRPIGVTRAERGIELEQRDGTRVPLAADRGGYVHEV